MDSCFTPQSFVTQSVNTPLVAMSAAEITEASGTTVTHLLHVQLSCAMHLAKDPRTPPCDLHNTRIGAQDKDDAADAVGISSNIGLMGMRSTPKVRVCLHKNMTTLHSTSGADRRLLQSRSGVPSSAPGARCEQVCRCLFRTFCEVSCA